MPPRQIPRVALSLSMITGLLLSACGGGGGSGGGTGSFAAASISAKPAQQGFLMLAESLTEGKTLANLAISQNLNTVNANYSGHSSTPCTNGGSVATSSTSDTIDFVSSNCLQSNYTSNGSVGLLWSNPVNYTTCGSYQVPANLDYTYTMNHFILSGSNPTTSLDGNGTVTLTETGYSCTGNAPTLNIDETISLSSPMTFALTLSTSTASFSFNATITSMTEHMIFTFDNSNTLTNVSSALSATYTMTNTPGNFTIATNAPFEVYPNVSSALSSGSMTITTPTGETDQITAEPNAQVTVVTTANGITQTTTESWATLLGF